MSTAHSSMPASWDAEAVKLAVIPRIPELVVEWGVKTTGRRTAKGWLECHAVGREDSTPSAGIDLETGVYKDLGGSGETLSIFALAVKIGAFPDFPSTVNSLGERYGVPPKRGWLVGPTTGDPFVGKVSASPFAGVAVNEPPKVIKALPRPKSGRATFEEAADSVKGERKQHWTYSNADGSESLRVVRYETPKGKTYRPVHHADGIGWLLGDPPGSIPLYRLPDLIATGTEHPVFVLEGEKCVDLARNLGLAATTSAHGAQSPHKTDWSSLAGRDVVIVPDSGKAGETYKTKVAKILAALSPRPSMRVLDLPGLADGEDLEQWLGNQPDGWDDERSGQELRRLAESAVDPMPGIVEPEPEIGPATIPIPGRIDPRSTEVWEDDYTGATEAELGIIDAADVTLENPEWLWDRRFLKGKINLIAGEGGDGKTTIAIMVGSVVTVGGNFPDGTPSGSPGVVMILAAEDGAGDTIKPRFIAAGADVSPGKLKFLTAAVSIPKRGNQPAMVHPVSLKDSGYWRAVFRRYRPTVFIIDPLPAYLGRGVNDNKNSDVQEALKEFTRVAGEFSVCVIAITHTGKATDRKLIHKVLGSVAYTNVARVVHVTLRDPSNPDMRYLERPKCNLDEPADALAYKLVSFEFERNGVTYKTSRSEFEPEPVAIDAEAMANPKRDGRPARGPDAKQETAFAIWLFDFLNGHDGWAERSEVIAEAGKAGLIGKQHPGTKKWSNFTMLYRAQERLTDLGNARAGKKIEQQDIRRPNDRYPRLFWRLVNDDAPF